MCETSSPLNIWPSEKTQTGTNMYNETLHQHSSFNEMLTQENTFIDPCSSVGVRKVLSDSDNDFSNLKTVVLKLEKISDTLALVAAADQYEQFGKYIATLLRGIPYKKFLYLKQKFIGEIVSTKMAVSELNNSSPATGNCTVFIPVNPPEHGVEVNPGAHQSYPTSSERFHNNSGLYAFSEQTNGMECSSAMDSDTPTTSPVLPTSVPLNSLNPTLLKGNEESRITESLSCTSNRYAEDTLEIEIEEGTELVDIKPNIFEISTSLDYGIKDIGGSITSGESGGMIPGCKESFSKHSASLVENSKDQQTSHLTCNKCNIDFTTIIDMRRHFTDEHPDEIPSIKMMCSEENQMINPKIHSFGSLNSVAPHGELEELKDLDGKQMQCQVYDIHYQGVEMKGCIRHEELHKNLFWKEHRGWKNEKVVANFGMDHIVEITNPHPWQHKALLVLRLISKDVGIFYENPSASSNQKVYMYIKDKHVVGCMVTTPVKVAYRLISSERDLDTCSEELYPVKCGISLMWTLSSHRRQGIASEMLDTVRRNFICGTILNKNELSFLNLTPDGKKFVAKYLNSSIFLIYTGS